MWKDSIYVKDEDASKHQTHNARSQRRNVGHSPNARNVNRNQIFIILVILPVRYNEMAVHIAATCAKAHSEKLHRWRDDSMKRNKADFD